ncbi:single strand DNA binding protein [Idiomarinaceae phage Phi1M2-2]|uniref:single strand DNA binding protein n=1 Tax=Idiomarinaceae phage Phi1M2-2 TaxID=1527515 RepID=UPI0004F64F29|nr:single strand DNA binding protein [Idiomarinaceae phage Phi1M2-2]AIM40818.1 putative ssDNA annealing protein [Idiomarinaceae phage Phi1M2-2]
MSFWNLTDSNDNLDTTGSFESGGGDIEPIPKDTQVKAAIDEAKWDDYEGDEYISLRWTVLAPAEFKNRKIFQKVRVMDSDGKKADKAKKMLAAIAANAGGGLLNVAGKPSDQDLQKNLLNKPMALKLQVWKIDKKRDGTPLSGDDIKKGNWVSQVAPLKKQSAQEAPAPEPEQNHDDDDEFDI